MTTTRHAGYNEASSVKFNAKHCRELGWYRKIPLDAIKPYPNLGKDSLGFDDDRKLFALAVYQMQLDLFDGDEDEADGKLGTGTRSAMCRRYDPVPDTERHYLHYAMRQAAPHRENISKVLTYKDKGGLDLHRSAKYLRKDRPIRLIVLHWSATTTIKGCYRALMNEHNSSHFGVGLSKGEPRIYQWFDTEYETAHGKGGNQGSIGIDICSTPVVSALKSLTRKGHLLERVPNSSGRGDSEVLTLDPQVELATAELVVDLCKLHGIPIQWPVSRVAMGTGEPYMGLVGPDFMHSQWGIVDHSKFNKKKWDVGCWLPGIIARIKEIAQ